MTHAAPTLHLVDVENLLGERRLTATVSDVRETVDNWFRAVGKRPDDHVVIAANPAFGLTAGLAVPAAQLLVRHGEDGADLALLDWAPIEHIAERYDRVVIGSGDHIFAMFIRSLLIHGVKVRVCTRRGAMSRALRLALATGADVDRPTTPAPAGAGQQVLRTSA